MSEFLTALGFMVVMMITLSVSAYKLVFDKRGGPDDSFIKWGVILIAVMCGLPFGLVSGASLAQAIQYGGPVTAWSIRLLCLALTWFVARGTVRLGRRWRMKVATDNFVVALDEWIASEDRTDSDTDDNDNEWHE